MTSSKTTALSRILLCAVTVIHAGCISTPLTFADHSFRFRTAVLADGPQDTPTLFLELEKSPAPGSDAQDYVMDYLIDGDATLRLSDTSGVPAAGLRIDLPGTGERSDKGGTLSHAWRLPLLKEGDHTVHLEVRTARYTQTLEQPFTVLSTPFHIHADVFSEAGSPVSTLLVVLTDGRPDREYSGQVRIDGTPVGDGVRVNFSRTPTLTVGLPLLRPGQHSLEVSLTDGYRTTSATASFTEPVRHPVLGMGLRYDPASGCDVLFIPDNPYGLRVDATAVLVVTGHCYAFSSNGIGWSYMEPHSDRRTTTARDSVSVSSCISDTLVVAHRDSTCRAVSSRTAVSAVWTPYWENDQYVYRETGTKTVPYEVSAQALTVTLHVETIPGVKPSVSNGIPDCGVVIVEEPAGNDGD